MPAHLTVGSTYSCWCTALNGLAVDVLFIVIGAYEDPTVSGGWRNICLTSGGAIVQDTTYNIMNYCTVVHEERAIVEPAHWYA